MSFLKLKVVPYYPELGNRLGSITSAILMKQLEYWFGKMKNKKFYKFLEPCDNGSYQKGESWCEELGMSKSEFRSAFSRIGTVYKSKKEFDNSENKFQGKFYCSYIERLERRTYYIRNNKLVNEFMEELLKDDYEENEISTNEESESLEIKKVDFYKSENFISTNEEIEFPITVDYHKNKQDINTKEDTSIDKNNENYIFRKNLEEYKNIIINSTGMNLSQIDMVIDIHLLKNIDMDLLLDKISKSKFLKGESNRKPRINNFTQKSMIDKILVGFYDDINNNSINKEKSFVEKQLENSIKRRSL